MRFVSIVIVLLHWACAGEGSTEPQGPDRVVVLGSSTAFGVGVSDTDNTWVRRYTRALQEIDPEAKVRNLSFPGITTYSAQPSSYTPAGGRPTPSHDINITTALALSPTAVIVNFPSNDQDRGFSLGEQQQNFERIHEAAQSAAVPIWFTTTQPRNFSDPADRQGLMTMRDFIIGRFANVIDFWTDLADADGRILPEFDSGDGIHFNDDGHALLSQRALAATQP